MNKTVALVQVTDEIEINKNTAPEFLLQYQKSVLLCLKEQGIINDSQYHQCIEELTNQFFSRQ